MEQARNWLPIQETHYQAYSKGHTDLQEQEYQLLLQELQDLSVKSLSNLEIELIFSILLLRSCFLLKGDTKLTDTGPLLPNRESNSSQNTSFLVKS